MNRRRDEAGFSKPAVSRHRENAQAQITFFYAAVPIASHIKLGNGQPGRRPTGECQAVKAKAG